MRKNRIISRLLIALLFVSNASFAGIQTPGGGGGLSPTGDGSGLTGITATQVGAIPVGGNAGTVTNGVYTTGAGTVFLAPNGSAAALTSFPTLNQNTTGNAGTVTGLSVTTGKTLTDTNSITLSGTDSTTLTFPAYSTAIADYSFGTFATAGGTTTLTSTSPTSVQFTGTLNQTLVLPDARTVPLGRTYTIDNDSNGVVTVNANDGSSVHILPANTVVTVDSYSNSTLAGAWDDSQYWGEVFANGKYLGVNNSLTLAGTDGTTQTFGSANGYVLSSVTNPAANPVTGTPSSTTFLRGDGTWTVPSSSSSSSYYVATVGGTADAITLTPVTACASYASCVGNTYLFKSTGQNTTTTNTVNISGLGALSTTMGNVALPIAGILSGNFYTALVESATSIRIAPYDSASVNGDTYNGPITSANATTVTGNGSNLTINTGNGGATSGNSGNLILGTPIPTTNGSSGNVALSSGNGTGANGGTGNVTITVGNGASQSAGILTLQGGQSAAAQSGNSGGVVIAGGAGAASSAAGGPVVLTGGAGSTTIMGGIGGAASLTAGVGGLALSGGVTTVAGGQGGATGAGGALSLKSGAGGATSGASGIVTVASGTTTSGASGAVTFGSGNATAGASGTVNVSSGTSSTAATGVVTVSTSNATASAQSSGNLNITVGNGGATGLAGIATIQGGTSSTTQSGYSGGVVINGGAAGAVASIAGGPVVLIAGGGSTTTTGGVGGAVTINGGLGGLALAGGAVNIVSGQGGSTGAGGVLTIKSGAGGTTSGNSGAVVIDSGTVVSGTTGTVSIGTANSSNTFIGRPGNAGAAYLGTTTVTGSLIPLTTNGITGTTLADNANAGSIGEVISSSVVQTITGLTTNTNINVTSLSLTAGDWDVWGSVIVSGATTTSFTNSTAGISTTSLTAPATNLLAVNQLPFVVSSFSVDLGAALPQQRINVSSTTTAYLVCQSTFTVSTAGCGGTLYARRRR